MDTRSNRAKYLMNPVDCARSRDNAWLILARIQLLTGALQTDGKRLRIQFLLE